MNDDLHATPETDQGSQGDLTADETSEMATAELPTAAPLEDALDVGMPYDGETRGDVVRPRRRRRRRRWVLAAAMVGLIALAGGVVMSVSDGEESVRASERTRRPEPKVSVTTTVPAPTTTTTVAPAEVAPADAGVSAGPGTGSSGGSYAGPAPGPAPAPGPGPAPASGGSWILTCPDGRTFTLDHQPTATDAQQYCGGGSTTPPPPAPVTIIQVTAGGSQIGVQNVTPASNSGCRFDFSYILSDGRSVTGMSDTVSFAGLAPGNYSKTWTSDPQYGAFPSPVTRTYSFKVNPDGTLGMYSC